MNCLRSLELWDRNRLVGGIYEVRCRDGRMYHDICTKLIKTGSGIENLMDGYTNRQDKDSISLLLFFFKIRKVG
jgi:hypothetical protein